MIQTAPGSVAKPSVPSAGAALYGRRVSLIEPKREVERGPCPACAGVGLEPRFAIEDLAARIAVCTQCGLGRLHPMPSEAEVRSFYPDRYYGEPGNKFWPSVEALVRLVGSRHVRFLSRGLPAGARILDVGCGRGVHLRALADRGFAVHGFEMSESAARGVDPRAKLAIAADLRGVGYPAGFFDQVILWHVLEHLRDPVGTLEEVQRVLRPGGRLVVAVPNFGSLQARWAGPAWFHLDPPRHLYHFTVQALERMLEAAGFRVLSHHHFSLRQNPFGWVQSALNRRSDLPPNALYALLQRTPLPDIAELDAASRRRLLLSYVLGMPLGLILAVGAALLHSGATVHMVCRADRIPGPR
ncbi:MAG: class I SAM-dependent methyltransferase [Deltaproteobacteria bacterium]|nr:class I SAM-dependent methyltransferase [Deltaproteobacteria bacterium]